MSLITSIAKAKFNKMFEKKSQRIDVKVPLDLRLERTVSINPDKFILGEDKLSIIQPPDDMEISAIGYYNLFDTKYYNIYLDGHDNIERLLQININEIMYYETKWTQFNLSQDEWHKWLNEENGFLGWKDIEIGGNNYSRIIQQDGADWIQPITFSESITDDMFVPEVMKNQHEAMLFGRAIDLPDEELVENLFAEKIEDNNGAYVTCRAGIMLDVSDLKIL